ncbi:MAG: NADH-quinone oxidoreductase subunit J [Isosphaeraceae bacterium]|nr:NADH-quinone oxidoreductase subunit J [Isosphaeraceae bacterium]
MTTLFVIISVLGLLAALGTVLARNLVHAALYLVAFFFIVACQFVLLEAEFLAAVQVLVYIGAVAILMMFGIMLTRHVQGDETTTIARGAWALPALIAGLGLFLVLAFGINDQVGLKGRSPWRAAESRPPVPKVEPGEPVPARAAAVNDMGRTVGRELLTRFVVPFEVAGLLLTAALVGAVVVAYREGDDAESPRRGSHAAWVVRGNGDGHPAPGNGQVAGAEPVSTSAG